MAAYPPTNTVILTESASNIRRIFSILESIDIETYKDSLAVIKVEHADATTLGEQISEIYGAEIAPTSAAARRSRTTRRTATPPTPVAGTAARGRVRILTDERTNSLIVLSPRTQLAEVRELVNKLDVPVTGGGRIHVRYLNHANAEELAQTLSALISGQPARTAGGAGAGAQAQQLRAAVTELAEGIGVTADPATNSLVIQASQEGFATLGTVIEKLDVERPQVLVEGLIMEVDVTGREELGFGAVYRMISGDTDLTVASLSGVTLRQAASEDDDDFEDEVASTAAGLTAGPLGSAAAPFMMNFLRDKLDLEEGDGSLIQSIITAAAADGDANIISAPHILTSDNEEAEIRIGDNIPIITSRVQQPGTAGVATGFNTSVNVERQDIGVTLRVTPQITEGDSLRLQIFQEITDVTESEAGNVEEVGVTLKNRRIENTVVVRDHETVVIGGLISDDYTDVVSKVPFLGDIPVLGWLFKTTLQVVNKKNLLVFLTPHIVRSPEDLERETIRKREEFAEEAGESLRLTESMRAEEEERRQRAEAEGVPYEPEGEANPVRTALLRHEARYPLERMREIEREEREERERAAAGALTAEPTPQYYVQAAIYGNEAAAMQTLTELVDAGYDGSLISGQTDGVVLFEVRLGPYPTLEEAQRAGGLVRRSYGLAPAVMIGAPEEP
jgi:general secretion pathway protein D